MPFKSTSLAPTREDDTVLSRIKSIRNDITGKSTNTIKYENIGDDIDAGIMLVVAEDDIATTTT